ncbi:MAG: NAD(P)H-hydrate dehydratase [bacterium]
MKLLTSSQMRGLDRKAIEEYGIPGIALMENASRGAFETIDALAGPLEGKKALVVCGKGNNGGDGFAVARYLLNAGAKMEIVSAAQLREIGGDAATNLNICKKLKIPITVATDPANLNVLKKLVREADFIVDALLGTGVAGPVKPLYLKIIQIINKSECPVFSLDIPSGVQADDGRVLNGAVEADYTITFGSAKIGLFMHPGAGNAGEIYIADIGIPAESIDETEAGVFLTTRDYVGACVKERPAAAHKGDCGRLLIVGGSRGMAGAPSLSGMSALRTGAGLVYVAAPKGILGVIGKKLVEAVALPMDEDARGLLSRACLGDLLKAVKKVDAIAIGPGIGVSDETAEVVYRLIGESKVPMLIDADALNCVALDPDVLKTAKAPIALTPHPGEMARLAKLTIGEVQASRLDTAREFARKYGATVVLKGANTVVAAPGGVAFVNATGNPGMATAGSGDVLSGIGGALLAEGIEPFAAAACAAYLHGAAGDKAAEKIGRRSIMASDIARCIPDALAEVMAGECGLHKH